MMRHDHQANDQDERSGTKYQNYREDVLEHPVLACYPLPLLQRHPGPGRMIAGGRIVQVESSAAPAQAVSWVPSRATNPNHHASGRPAASLRAVYSLGVASACLDPAGHVSWSGSRRLIRPCELAREGRVGE